MNSQFCPRWYCVCLPTSPFSTPPSILLYLPIFLLTSPWRLPPPYLIIPSFRSKDVAVLFPSQQSDRLPYLRSLLPSENEPCLTLTNRPTGPSNEPRHEALPLHFNTAGCGRGRQVRAMGRTGRGERANEPASHRVNDSEGRDHAISQLTEPRDPVLEAAPPGGAIHVIAVMSPPSFFSWLCFFSSPVVVVPFPLAPLSLPPPVLSPDLSLGSPAGQPASSLGRWS